MIGLASPSVISQIETERGKKELIINASFKKKRNNNNKLKFKTMKKRSKDHLSIGKKLNTYIYINSDNLTKLKSNLLEWTNKSSHLYLSIAISSIKIIKMINTLNLINNHTSYSIAHNNILALPMNKEEP